VSLEENTSREDAAVRYVDSPIGRLRIAADARGLREIRFLRERAEATREECEAATAAPSENRGEMEAQWIVAETVKQLSEYFEGARRIFDLRLAPRGTAFQQQVWNALLSVGYGELVSYGEIARRIGLPRASRAVGAANGANPIPIVIPCHRVIGASGTLTGYGGGLDIKEKLLLLEGIGIDGRGSRAARVASHQVLLPLKMDESVACEK